ncbi:MAG: DUF1326 domain-containing protein [Planctomycetota bacterium]|nr:MAG: DUF1326 domain-containing protein [Planctomycetota bacterium]
MLRSVVAGTMVALCLPALALADGRLRGTYVEARTCQVYTGPCFANGEVGSTGKDAILAWEFSNGNLQGVDLAGLRVAVILKTDNTLGFNGLADAKYRRAVVVVDARADAEQRAALRRFAAERLGLKDAEIAEVAAAEMQMRLDLADLTAELNVPGTARLKLRKARPGDCICSNESAYYPPLTELSGFVPGVTIEGDVTARRLGRRWSIPDSRTAYLGTFDIAEAPPAIAQSL